MTCCGDVINRRLVRGVIGEKCWRVFGVPNLLDGVKLAPPLFQGQYLSYRTNHMSHIKMHEFYHLDGPCETNNAQ